jgi:hypothetical protein
MSFIKNGDVVKSLGVIKSTPLCPKCNENMSFDAKLNKYVCTCGACSNCGK